MGVVSHRVWATLLITLRRAEPSLKSAPTRDWLGLFGVGIGAAEALNEWSRFLSFSNQGEGNILPDGLRATRTRRLRGCRCRLPTGDGVNMPPASSLKANRERRRPHVLRPTLRESTLELGGLRF
eukprot:8130979-Pyramimonas_sp.AAC.1